MMTTICYKLNTPIIYNAGTSYEQQEDTFLECMIYATKEQAQVTCDKLNLTATDRVYFVDEQEPF